MFQIAKKDNIFTHATENFDMENFILDILNVDLPTIISTDKKDSNYSLTRHSILDKYLPLKN